MSETDSGFSVDFRKSRCFPHVLDKLGQGTHGTTGMWLEATTSPRDPQQFLIRACAPQQRHSPHNDASQGRQPLAQTLSQCLSEGVTNNAPKELKPWAGGVAGGERKNKCIC